MVNVLSLFTARSAIGQELHVAFRQKCSSEGDVLASYERLVKRYGLHPSATEMTLFPDGG